MDSRRKIAKIIEMKKRFIFLIITCGSLFAQSADSLFWFHPDSANEPAMKWPIVINQIFSPEYWGFIDSNKTQTIESKDGFRIQVFESKSIEEAQAFYRKSTVDFSEEVYLIFDAPFYKVRIGNCVSRNEANNLQNTLKEMGYKTAWIVRSRIE